MQRNRSSLKEQAGERFPSQNDEAITPEDSYDQAVDSADSHFNLMTDDYLLRHKFNEDKAYKTTDTVYYNGDLYEFINDHSGPWDEMVVEIYKPIKDWVTAVFYRVGMYVNYSNKLYKCIVEHTASAFTTDLSGGKWVSVSYSSDDVVSNEAYSITWQGATGVAASKNALYDTFENKLQEAKDYADSVAVGLLDDRGNYDPTITSMYPTSANNGSGPEGAIKKGDIWTFSEEGVVNSIVVKRHSTVRALIDNPLQINDNWQITQVGIGYTPENTANKATGTASLNNSDTTFPSERKVKANVDLKEDTENKVTDFSVINNTTFPTTKAVDDKYIDQSGSKLYAVATGTNAYILTLTPAITVYSAGQTFRVKFTNTNTTASTININGLGTKSLKKNVSEDLIAADIKSDGIYYITYDGVNFQLFNSTPRFYRDLGISEFFDEMTYSHPYWTVSGLQLNNGVTGTISDFPGHHGSRRITTGGISSNGSAGLKPLNTNLGEKILGRYKFTIVWKLRIEFPSTSSDEFIILAGMNNADLVKGSSSICFYYDRTIDGNFWACITRASSIETKTVTSVAIVPNGEYYLKIDVNAAGDEVVFSIANSIGGAYSVVATHTTNIPAACPEMVYILKTVGIANRQFFLDYYYEKLEIAR